MKAETVTMAGHGQSSSNATEPVTREGILKLMKFRDSIDDQIKALGGILHSNHIGMKEPLVDAEGFPRNDIDVYQVRIARHKIICLQTDYKNATKEIEAKLLAYHEQVRQSGQPVEAVRMDTHETNGSTNSSARTDDYQNMAPIARVNLVSDASPAFHAGVKVDDEILSVGSITSDNFTSLQDIGNLVQRSQGSVVTIRVKRHDLVVQLALIPGPWSGRGLIGCNIIPVQGSSSNGR